jgi:hypothetical protein
MMAVEVPGEQVLTQATISVGSDPSGGRRKSGESSMSMLMVLTDDGVLFLSIFTNQGEQYGLRASWTTVSTQPLQ